jgi:hypothetical protein
MTENKYLDACERRKQRDFAAIIALHSDEQDAGCRRLRQKL